MRAHHLSQLARQSEYDVKVRHRQQELALPVDPLRRAQGAALWARSVATRVVEQVPRLAALAVRQVSAESFGLANTDLLHCARMTRQHGFAVVLQIRRTVLPHHLGEGAHDRRE